MTESPRQVLILRSNPIAPDPRVEKTAQALSDAGLSITMLCWDRTGALDKEEARSYGTIHRLKIPAPYSRGIQNLPSLMRFELGLLRWLLKNHRSFDMIHACDFDTILPALIVSKVMGKRLVYDIFDFYSDMLRATPEILKQIIRVVDYWAIGKVDAVILADDARMRQIGSANPRRVVVIYNSPPDSRDSVNLRDWDKFSTYSLRIAFIGLLHIERGLLELLEVMDRHPEWLLDLAGFGGDELEILEKAQRLSNVRVHGRVSYEKAMALNARSDILIATYDPGIRNHRFASPNKLFEAMMLGLPIVVASGTNMDRIINETGAGLIVRYSDTDELEAALIGLASDPALRLRLGLAGRAAYEARYHWDIMRSRLVQLYSEI